MFQKWIQKIKANQESCPVVHIICHLQNWLNTRNFHAVFQTMKFVLRDNISRQQWKKKKSWKPLLSYLIESIKRKCDQSRNFAPSKYTLKFKKFGQFQKKSKTLTCSSVVSLAVHQNELSIYINSQIMNCRRCFSHA